MFFGISLQEYNSWKVLIDMTLCGAMSALIAILVIKARRGAIKKMAEISCPIRGQEQAFAKMLENARYLSAGEVLLLISAAVMILLVKSYIF